MEECGLTPTFELGTNNMPHLLALRDARGRMAALLVLALRQPPLKRCICLLGAVLGRLDAQTACRRAERRGVQHAVAVDVRAANLDALSRGEPLKGVVRNASRPAVEA